MGSVVAAHELSCLTRDLTRVPCIGRRILNHWTAREVLCSPKFKNAGISREHRKERSIEVKEGCFWRPCGVWTVIMQCLLNPLVEFEFYPRITGRHCKCKRVTEQHLRHVEKDVLIPKIMREKARERCSEQVQGILEKEVWSQRVLILRKFTWDTVI
ncbi:COX assembly mitochondrial protein homolog isoform X6 [Delphinapterus leucas]|uniref:COX assembly mitochondrial protein homolog isoform X6 n=1 Tax=Delphinapterus leucas TaxID=9749 RepID=A0A2Y9MEE1_DELLE|nr:COX assembly mitochondrial protein homolog isoform X6 [Delphinapterus leucas]